MSAVLIVCTVFVYLVWDHTWGCSEVAHCLSLELSSEPLPSTRFKSFVQLNWRGPETLSWILEISVLLCFGFWIPPGSAQSLFLALRSEITHSGRGRAVQGTIWSSGD